jgi:carboxyl-terminal processing protease
VVPPRADAVEDGDVEARELLEALPARLEADADAFARELGAPIVVTPQGAPDGSPRFVLGPRALQPAIDAAGVPPLRSPTLWLDRDRRLLVADAPDLDGVLQALAGLRSLARHPGGALSVAHAASLAEAAERVSLEVADSWAGFHLGASPDGAAPDPSRAAPRAARSPTRAAWRALCERHAWRSLAASDAARAIDALQAWLTPLGDFHTWVRPIAPQLGLPYGAYADGDDLVLTRVPTWTAGFAAGARPGWRVLGRGARALTTTTPGAPHMRPWLVARRALAGRAGDETELEARGPGAQTARWRERWVAPTTPPAAWELLPSGIGYLWVGAFAHGLGVEDIVDEAFDALGGLTQELIVDLRGNTGGRQHLATALRDRFLRERTRLGTLRRTHPGGALGPPEALWGEPSTSGRWAGRVRFLTDALTYSAAEDTLLGLAGLPHVQIVGSPSGGGTGRLRRLPLLPGWRLTITTALSWDREGRPIEGRGLPVDLPVSTAPDPDPVDRALRLAQTAPWR